MPSVRCASSGLGTCCTVSSSTRPLPPHMSATFNTLGWSGWARPQTGRKRACNCARSCPAKFHSCVWDRRADRRAALQSAWRAEEDPHVIEALAKVPTCKWEGILVLILVQRAELDLKEVSCFMARRLGSLAEGALRPAIHSAGWRTEGGGSPRLRTPWNPA